MESSKPTQPDSMHMCPTCGAWIRNERVHCPWCGTANTARVEDVSSSSTTVSDKEVEDTYSGNGFSADERDTAMLLPAEIWHADAEPILSPGHSPRFWRRSFLTALLLIVVMMLGFGALGVYRGLNDRQLQNRRSAIAYYEEGNELLEQGNYELALANFREALRLEANFEAAAAQMRVAEQALEQQNRPTPSPEVIATVTLTPMAAVPADIERLFDEATAALTARDWEEAAATFDQLSSQAPGFRTQEVADGLFQARMEAGRAALQADELDTALRHFDHALAIRPDDEEVQQLRRMTATYRSGANAYEDEDWEVAAEHLRVVYLSDPSFLQVQELLAQAHFELGREYAAREIWCDAAQQYRSSVAVMRASRVSERAEDAADRCNTRVVEARATPTFEREEPEEDPEEILPITTPLSLPPTPVVEELPTATPTRAAPPTVPPAPPTEPAPAPLYTLVGGVGTRTEGCTGSYIFGTVRAADGAPLAGVTIVAADDYGNRLVATSKSNPPGQYDIPISGANVSYRVTVVDGDQPLSTPAILARGDAGSGQTSCFVIDWQRTR
ncbi:MAG: tetratricopeptide repeat protein [Ardenticatenaceae bacterium]